MADDHSTTYRTPHTALAPPAVRRATSRREFFRLVSAAGALAALPGLVVACDSDEVTAPLNGIPASGSPLLIDFAKGDAAFLQFALVLENVEAEFYTRVVEGFASSTITIAEQGVLTEIRNHEVAHREFLERTLGADFAPAVTPTFRGIDFADRTAVLTAAKEFEDLGVAAYNGVVQYLTAAENVLAVAKIVSVEARHAATIRDLLSGRSADFSPNPTDDVFRPAKVAATAQANLVDKLGFVNAPSTFVQGPRQNG